MKQVSRVLRKLAPQERWLSPLLVAGKIPTNAPVVDRLEEELTE